MKIFHASDIHYCRDYLEEVDRCFRAAIQHAFDTACAVAVLSGDLFDRRIELHEPAVLAALGAVRWLAEYMPVLILQGTYSHDAPGSLDPFRMIAARYPVYVADEIGQVALLYGAEWQACPSGSLAFDHVPNGTAAMFSCLPSINKAEIAAAIGCDKAAHHVGNYVADILALWAPINRAARADGVPTVMVSHGTVSGCMTEHGVPMVGLDHEYTAGALFAAEASAVMLGHIHKHQSWEYEGRRIAYPGSVGRLHFGEVDPKGALIWEVGAAGAAFEFVETPAKRLLQIDVDGAPDMGKLAEIAKTADGAHVRVRYRVDEEHRHAVDRDAIKALFAAAAVVKVEGAINPIVRTRASGIGRLPTDADKLTKWAETTNTPAQPLLDRLHLLMGGDPEQIAYDLLDRITATCPDIEDDEE